MFQPLFVYGFQRRPNSAFDLLRCQPEVHLDTPLRLRLTRSAQHQYIYRTAAHYYTGVYPTHIRHLGVQALAVWF